MQKNIAKKYRWEINRYIFLFKCRINESNYIFNKNINYQNNQLDKD